MELAGSVYLYTLAALGMTFVTMSAIVVVLRHTTGAPPSSYELFNIHLYIEQGFLVAGLSILPMLIALFDVSHSVVWQVASAVSAVCFGVHGFSLVWRRRIVTRQWPTWGVRMLVLVRWLVVIALLSNAVGAFGGWGAGIYGAMMTYFLVHVCVLFSRRLKIFLVGLE